MTITISEERIYLDRDSLSDRILPSLTPALPGGRSGATEEQPHIGGQRPIASLVAQSSKVGFVFALLIYIAYRYRLVLSPLGLVYKWNSPSHNDALKPLVWFNENLPQKEVGVSF